MLQLVLCREILYAAVVSLCILSTINALPVAAVGAKKSNFCCHCTMGEDGDKKESKVISNLGTGLGLGTGIKTVNVLTSSISGCDGLSSGTSVSGGDGLVVSSGGGLITQPGGGGLLTQSGGGLLVPSVQVQVPQVLVAQPAQFPSAMNVIPQQQPLLNLQPMQPSLFNIQQPKISTQCCATCPDGNGICCCTPGAKTTAAQPPPPPPRETHTLYPPYQPASAPVFSKSKSTILLTCIPTLPLMNIFMNIF